MHRTPQELHKALVQDKLHLRCRFFARLRTAFDGVSCTSSPGKSRVKPSNKPMMPSMRDTGTEIIHGLRPASRKRYSPCSLADHAFPGPAPNAHGCAAILTDSHSQPSCPSSAILPADTASYKEWYSAESALCFSKGLQCEVRRVMCQCSFRWQLQHQHANLLTTAPASLD